MFIFFLLHEKFHIKLQIKIQSKNCEYPHFMMQYVKRKT